MKTLRSAKSAWGLARGAFLLCALLFAMVSNTGAAESGPGGLPDSLYWEVSMSPGYQWMNGCGEMGVKQADSVTDMVIQPPESAKADAHAGHHPRNADARSAPIDAASLEIALAELYSLVSVGARASPAY